MTTGTFLDRIIEAKQKRIAEAQVLLSMEEVRRLAESRTGDVRDFAAALTGPTVRVIAEIKRASPSKGPLHPGLDAATWGATYARAGAAAISVLCEEDFFLGSLQDLVAVRTATAQAGRPVPVLCKDFLFTPYQVYQARAAGADAVLLILAMLEAGLAKELLSIARGLGIEALVEVHDEGEADLALAIGARVIGINNRDLRTFHTDLAVTGRLAPRIRAGRRPLPRGGTAGEIIVGESGISSPADVARLAAAGCTTILVGESLVTAPDPAPLLAELGSIPAGVPS